MAKIDFRLVPNQDPQDILAKLKDHLVNEGYADIRIIVFGKAEPVVTSLKDPFVQRIAKIAEAYNGKRPSITPIVGGTLPLLGALQRYVGLPGLCAPGNPTYWANGAHAPNEHIRLADLDQAVQFNCYMFQNLAK
jgi:acetylornithine deacetylase/succinyl-diaminopimelate desuccinylase-like protein